LTPPIPSILGATGLLCPQTESREQVEFIIHSAKSEGSGFDNLLFPKKQNSKA